jgi:hypothetical protein
MQKENPLAHTIWENKNAHFTAVFGASSFQITAEDGELYLTGFYKIAGDAVTLTLVNRKGIGSLIGGNLALSIGKATRYDTPITLHFTESKSKSELPD